MLRYTVIQLDQTHLKIEDSLPCPYNLKKVKILIVFRKDFSYLIRMKDLSLLQNRSHSLPYRISSFLLRVFLYIDMHHSILDFVILLFPALKIDQYQIKSTIL